MCLPLIVNRLELESEKIHALGQHDDAISSVHYSSEASPGLRSHPPFISSDALPFSSQMSSSLVPGIAQSCFWDPRAAIFDDGWALDAPEQTHESCLQMSCAGGQEGGDE
jgi:hypothetical protein